MVTGLGSWLPPRVVTNDELTARLDTTDEWIRSRIGVVTRHVVAPGTATSDLSVEAARRALRSAGVPGAGGVVLATTTPDRPCPASAPEIASRLGLVDVPAFDIAAVCTGFVYGLGVGAGLITAGTADSLLVIGGDAYSTILDPRDRTTSVIFGDGAGAVVLRAGSPDEPGALGPFDLGSDGARSDLITVRAGGSRQRSSRDAVPPPGDEFFRMEGREVFANAVARMAEASRNAVKRRGWAVSEVDRVIAHQANVRILDAVSAELDVPREKFVSNIADVGNTSAASIPLALAHGVRTGELRAGQKVLLTAFGGGLTWGATTLVWPELSLAE
ncbi:3-oxoacyl-[acyl-carrier-protein] synthase 3 protein 3 [Lentzea sp. NBRC 102530]|nr:3-oxoacyl-[acyl-carrier-protein] synthase 3 protein 3 [Lentzea sp. NBRC 102530]